jgi:large subunit ribosomal protein L18
LANSSNYRVQLRRRREGKTDYQARKALVISGRPRLVTRTSIKNATAQIIIAKPIGDQTVAAANSRELIKKYGWKAPAGNIPAAYLTGLLCGLKAKAAGIDEAILDIGLITPTKGAKIFAVLNGVLDAGLDIPHGEEKLAKERSKGDHIAKYAKSLGADSEEYTAKFSKYTAQKIAPEKLPEHFNKVKAEIIGSFKGEKVVAEPEPQQKPSQKEKEKAPVAKEKPAPKEKAAPAKEKAARAKEKAPAAPVAPADPAPVKEKAPAAKEEAPKPKASKAKATSAKAKAAPAKEKAEKAPKAEKAKKVPAKKKAPAKEKVAPKEKAPAKKAPAKAVAKPKKKGEKKE